MHLSNINQLSLNTQINDDFAKSQELIQHYLTTLGLASNTIKQNEIKDLRTDSVLITHYQYWDSSVNYDELITSSNDIVQVLFIHDRLLNPTQLPESLKLLIARCSILILGVSVDINAWQQIYNQRLNIIQLALPKPLPHVEFPHPQQGFRDAQVQCQLVFIGDLIASNQPLVILNALKTLRDMQQQNICLKWFSSNTESSYLTKIQQRIDDLDLNTAVHIIDTKNVHHNISDMLQKTDIYCCLSENRNIGLLCAAQLKISIVALHTPTQDDTYNQLGLRLAVLDSDSYAATLQQVIINPRLRSTLIDNALHVIQQYHPSSFYYTLQQALSTIDTKLPEIEPPSSLTQLSIRIEGPYDSSYSLAIVNREFARALHQLHPESTGLYSTEGGGDYLANTDFLERDTEIASIAQKSTSQLSVKTTLRLLYPPRVSGMQGIYNGLNLYGWEESYVPSTYIDDFNQHLQFATTMSRYVSRTLRDNGCNVPLFTTGIGVDHILHSPADNSSLTALPNKLRLLHISSCFPRKGVDVLLTAYGNAFSGEDQICLIIKTFANPHHNIAVQLQEWQATLNNAPEVILINEDLPPSAIRALYQAADVLVGPSRGEGFGLPMAEAMLHELPVITTGYGGQTDFCTDQTAWLIDYSFSRAASHISGNDSVWVEPCSKHLASLLKEFYHAYQHQSLSQFCYQKVKAGKALIDQHYHWKHVAQRCLIAIAALPDLPLLNPEPKLAIVTSWNSKCGIATYSKLLIKPALSQTLVLANKEINLISKDEPNVIRCWQSGGQPGSDNLQQLFNTIIENDIEQVLIQFNFSFFELDALQTLLQKLHEKSIQTFITLHSSADVYWGDELKTIRQLQPQINHVNRVFVHSIADLNQLKAFNIVDNVSLFPHGVKKTTNKEFDLPDQLTTTAQKLRGKTVIASYGFLLPHKGISVLIEAFKHFLQQQPNSHLLLITAQYPADISQKHLIECQELIVKLQLSEQVTMISDFLNDELSQAWLSLADCIVYPYQHTKESSSAAVRWGLALEKPIFCTPLAIFDDVASAVHFLPGIQAEQISQGISTLLSNPQSLAEKFLVQKQWLTENDWHRLSGRLKHILSGAFLEKAIDNNLKSDFLR